MTPNPPCVLDHEDDSLKQLLDGDDADVLKQLLDEQPLDRLAELLPTSEEMADVLNRVLDHADQLNDP